MAEVGCVVFDIDDTLYLERDYVRSGLRAVGHLLGRRGLAPGFFDVGWDAFEQGVTGRLFDEALARCGVAADPSLVADLVDCYRNHTPDIRLLADAAFTITALHGQTKLAVLSDGPLPSQRAKSKALGIEHWAELVVLTSEFGDAWSKPSPTAFEFVERRLGMSSECCAYVADNPRKDFVAPAARGWRTVRIRREGSLHHSIDSGEDVDIEVEELSPLVAAFGGSAPGRPTGRQK
jgi:putative hydrolase of the HAD superfamily